MLLAAVPEEFLRFALQTRIGALVRNLAAGWFLATFAWAALHGPTDWHDSKDLHTTILGVVNIMPLGLLWGYITYRRAAFFRRCCSTRPTCGDFRTCRNLRVFHPARRSWLSCPRGVTRNVSSPSIWLAQLSVFRPDTCLGSGARRVRSPANGHTRATTCYCFGASSKMEPRGMLDVDRGWGHQQPARSRGAASRWQPDVAHMSKLIYITNMSLDGYVEDRTGAFDWVNPDEVFGFITELLRPIGTYLYGRRLYETMACWEAPVESWPPEHREFARVWQKGEKIVFSRTLTHATTRHTRVERNFDLEAIRTLKRESAHDISIGGAELAGLALEGDLVDECQLFVNPVIVGGGKPAFREASRLRLELLETRRFGTGVIHLHYRARGRTRGVAGTGST